LITSNGEDLNLDLPEEQKNGPHLTQLPTASPTIMTDAQLREMERNNMQAALKAADGKLFGKGGAAELLGLKPTTLASRFKRLAIKLK
jgi:transcriptional regulator with GAF, ATPase, and Fis domain